MEPWIKIIDSAGSKEEAEEKVRKIREEGIHSFFGVINPEKEGDPYKIFVYDPSKADLIEQMAEKDTDLQTCVACGRKQSDIVMFRCVNCDALLCLDCGMERYFGGKIPVLHDCEKGTDTELLSNIGTCYRCGAVMGYKSIPFPVRIKMLSEITGFVPFFIKQGIIGGFIADKLTVDYEVFHTFFDAAVLFRDLKELKDRSEEWWKQYIRLKNHLMRLKWSASYVIDVVDPPLNLIGYNDKILEEISKKMAVIFNELDFTVWIQSNFIHLYKNIENSKPEDLEKFLDIIIEQIKKRMKVMKPILKEPMNAAKYLKKKKKKILAGQFSRDILEAIEKLIIMDFTIAVIKQFPFSGALG